MENKTTIRPVPLIITVVALIGLAFLLVNAHRQNVAATAPAADAAAAQGQALCYVLNKPTSSGQNDIAYLKITSADGGAHTTGELGTMLAGKDRMDGTLSGSVAVAPDGNSILFTGTYASSGEGMNNVSDQLITLTDNEADIGYGDMVKNADGSYSYKDPSAVTYSLAIPSVDCATYDQLKTASN